VRESLTQISNKVSSTDSLVGEIATAAREQAQGIEQINTAITQMDQVTQSNSASAEESASAAEELDAQAATLKEMVEKTLFAASPDESRLQLSGVYVEVQKTGKLRMVASDGHRLSLIERETTIPDPAAWPSVIFPRKGLVEVRKLVEKSEGDVELSLQGSTAVMKKDSTELSMRLVEGEFPDYHQVIPKERKHAISFSREEFLSALRRLLVLTTERSRGIKLQVGKNSMEISVNTPDVGEGVEEIAVTHEGEGVIIGFNGRYLIEALGVMNEGQKVVLYLKDEVSPGLLQTEEDHDFSYVIMPMRIL
jgi:DNA polymerase-3 subunit beta